MGYRESSSNKSSLVIEIICIILLSAHGITDSLKLNLKTVLDESSLLFIFTTLEFSKIPKFFYHKNKMQASLIEGREKFQGFKRL